MRYSVLLMPLVSMFFFAAVFFCSIPLFVVVVNGVVLWLRGVLCRFCS